MSLAKSVTKWWWGWNPEKIEDWLEKMEVEGWHLYNITGLAIRFHFVKEDPKKVRYCADYQSTIGPEYKAIFQDTGWELVYSSMGWYIWRMEYADVRPDIYTDIDSMLDRNKRLITLLGFIAVVEVGILSFIRTTSENQSSMSHIIVLYTMLFSFIGYCAYNLLAYNKRLKVKKKL